jgi:hypothetical protein
MKHYSRYHHPLLFCLLPAGRGHSSSTLAVGEVTCGVQFSPLTETNKDVTVTYTQDIAEGDASL